MNSSRPLRVAVIGSGPAGIYASDLLMKSGRTVEIDGGPVERWAREVAHKHGFTLTGHTAEVFGLCNECRPVEG